jgi:pimeloyl-ACP methyl ester carboxylesterase
MVSPDSLSCEVFDVPRATMEVMTGRHRWLKWVGWIGAALAALVLIGPFLLPLPELDTVPPQQLAGPEDDFATVDGIEVRYRDAGSGEDSFLLLHGFGANTRSWTPVMGDFARLGRVVAFDRVGFGLTERPLDWEGRSPYGTETQLEIAVALMDRLDVDRATVVGHSAGAEVATALTLQHPSRVNALVLESPALDGSPGAFVRALAATPQGQRVVRFVGRRAADRVGELLESAYHDPSLVTDEILEGYLQPFEADDWDEGLALLTAASRADDLRDRLGEVEAPLLIITGDDDTWIPTAETVDLASVLPNAELAVIPRCGHVAHEECPAAFMDAVATWLGR